MIINTTYDLGEILYLKTDQDSKQRIVTVIEARAGGTIGYHLSCGAEGSWHYESEIVREKVFDD